MKNIVIFIVFSVIIMSFGRIEKEILDDVEVSTAVGYDYIGKHKIEATAVMPVIKPDKSIENMTLSSTGNISKETLNKINHKSFYPIVNGKLDVAIYSKKLAKQGLHDYIDTIHRDPSVGTRIILTIVDGNAKELLTDQYAPVDTGIYLSKLLENNMKKGLLPTSNLHTFLTAYYTKGIDPFLPLIKKDGKEIKISGIALFKDSHYVKSIPFENLFVFKALNEDLKLGGRKVTIKSHGKTEYVSVLGINTKKKITVHHQKSNPEIHIHLKVTGYIREFTGQVLNQQIIEKTAKELESKIDSQATSMIKDFQKSNIDPIGLGMEVRSRTRGWDYKKWKKQYPNLKVTVSSETNISEIGVVDGR
ncbi:Ger(x)C family spore germination protein [Bacillus sp. NEB1478]|uniref:Ger(x)C family spore germination protein n=1 Tax=Bacillus sp. NEB1478 TaxID=3073816 RepID=UPI002873CB53|nr:Ger(x)C family spore germination protein [Bacillus sp. NEB1478]WNB93365.1 Ger(x)C family spore germination protein [Bacillus sp. NEB1478]